MNEHVIPWLGAYHDGELKGHRLRQVENHLAECAACSAELAQLQLLRELLQESPAAEGLLPAERFVAQVGLRMPRHPEKPAWQRVLETGWRLAPAGLIGAWAFVQAVFIVAGIALIVLQVGVGIDVLGLEVSRETWLTAGLGFLGAELSDASRTILHLLSTLSQGSVLYITALIVIGLMYWSWLATLWARHQHQRRLAQARR
jgi:predicted anti-sigma-YlaC factor YlaD